MNERTKGISLDRSTRVIAIASGKGGVGKSTLTANLAAAFDRLGQRVGVLDADVYGHSIPHMLGVHQRPVVVDRMIVPPVRDELKLMSIGFFLDENEPVMWRGPMLHRALEQFLSDVHWGELDTLLVDM
ncbi:MAG: ATPase-like, ParA/MinD, partial [Gaiellaceae bacterium]|nr:ATPase-like, ParA/MinD [Gaiellaceae bacterium]